MAPKQKLSKLKKIISKMGSLLVAFSGGVDSTLLLKVVALTLPKDKVLAVTALSATYPESELFSAKKTAKSFRVEHRVIETRELRDKKFVSNPANRCYFCKRELFRRLKKIAAKEKLNFVADASSISDKDDFRPGDKAKKELNIRSPLQEAGLTKKDIRILSKRLRLVVWNKPSLACLASRIPYGNKIEVRSLKRINKAEEYLRGLGFGQVRLRHYDGLCRIEVFKEDIPALLARRNSVVENLKKLGYNYITVDLEGYRTGSMNEVIR